MNSRWSSLALLLLGVGCAIDSREVEGLPEQELSELTGSGGGDGLGDSGASLGGAPPKSGAGGTDAPAGAGGGTSGTSGAGGGEALPDPPLVTPTPDAGGGGAPPVQEPPPEQGNSPRSNLPAPPATGVARPSGAAANLRVLPWAGFRAAVSYTFDDANSSQIQNYAALQALGVPMTFYLQTNKQDAQSQTWAQAVRDGHELGNHTQSHQSTGPNIGADTDAATNFIESRFATTVWTMAAPNGSTAYADIARTRFLINRGVADQQIAPGGNADPFNLPCYIPPTGAGAAQFDAKINAVRAAGNWQTVLVHGFTGGSDGAYQPVPLQGFLDSVNYAKSLGDVWIDTVIAVGAYWLGQRTLAAAAPASANGVTTWNWTLPDNFPPGQFVRVVVDGGTLRQGETVLTWDEHGYYEVALDVGALSLSP